MSYNISNAHRHDAELHFGPGAVQVVGRPDRRHEVQPPLHRDAWYVADVVHALACAQRSGLRETCDEMFAAPTLLFEG